MVSHAFDYFTFPTPPFPREWLSDGKRHKAADAFEPGHVPERNFSVCTDKNQPSVLHLETDRELLSGGDDEVRLYVDSADDVDSSSRLQLPGTLLEPG